MYSIGLFQIRLSIFFYFLFSSGTNRRRTFFYDGGDLFLSLPVESQRFQQYRFGGAENIINFDRDRLIAYRTLQDRSDNILVIP